MKKVILVAAAVILSGCGLAQRQMWSEAEKKAEVQWRECLARHQAGELNYTGYADCSDKEAVSILDAARHPTATGARQVNAFRRLLGQKIEAKEITEIEAAVMEQQFIGMLQEQYNQQAAADRAAAQQSNQALHELGLELMRQGAAPQRNTMNCNTTYHGSSASTNCY